MNKHERKKRGICRDCNNVIYSGSTIFCEKHLEVSRTYNRKRSRRDYLKKWKLQRKERGICLFCTEHICDGSTTYCSFHRDHIIQKEKSHYNKRKEQKICQMCSKPVCKRSTLHCAKHFEIMKSYVKKYTSKNKDKVLIRNHFNSIKMRSKRKGIKLEIDFNAFNKWIICTESKCTYCGATKDYLNTLGMSLNRQLSIDRKDNSLGYSLDNICFACHKCNRLKSNFFRENEWKEICNKYIIPRFEEYHKEELNLITK